MDIQSTNLDSPTEAPKSSESITSEIEHTDTAEKHLIVPMRAESRRSQVSRYLDDNASKSAAKRLRNPSSIQSEENAEESNKFFTE